MYFYFLIYNYHIEAISNVVNEVEIEVVTYFMKFVLHKCVTYKHQLSTVIIILASYTKKNIFKYYNDTVTKVK